VNDLSPRSPLSFVSVGVDLLLCARDCFNVFEKENSHRYLPTSFVYAGGINNLLRLHNYAGEALAISELSLNNKTRYDCETPRSSTTRLA